MKPHTPGLAAALLFSCQAMASGDATREWRFDVSLDGRPIGEHHYVLREGGDTRELTSEASFRVRLLFVDAYRYEHRARESWRDGCLERLDARTRVNGKLTVVAGQLDRGEFRLTPDTAGAPLEACVRTFAYWDPGILESNYLLNPQTGEYVPVQVRELGTEVIESQPVERYRLSGGGRTPLEIDVWYTPAREWVALESTTPQGRRLRYSRK
jgi:hypothetical protein